MGENEATRRTDLDWARLTLLALTYLCISGVSWGTGSPARQEWAAALLSGRQPEILELCAVGLFLLVSGAAIRRSLERLPPGPFVVRAALRLFVPVVLGALVLSPAQVYLELLRADGYGRSYLEFLPDGLRGLYGVSPGGGFVFHGFHLAYLLLLFALSVALLPLFLLTLRSTADRAPGAATAVALAVLAPACFAFPTVPGGILSASIVLLAGYLVFDGKGAQRHLAPVWPWLAAAGALVVCASFLLRIATANVLRGGGAWGASVGLFGCAMERLGRLRPPSLALREAGLPFFVLSRPVTVWLAYLLRGLPLPSVLRTLTVTIIAGCVLASLSLAVRRIGLTRFLVGLRPPAE